MNAELRNALIDFFEHYSMSKITTKSIVGKQFPVMSYACPICDGQYNSHNYGCPVQRLITALQNQPPDEY